MNVYLLVKERSEERWIKQDLPTTRGLVICAECDLIVEVTHNLVKIFFPLQFLMEYEFLVSVSIL